MDHKIYEFVAQCLFCVQTGVGAEKAGQVFQVDLSVTNHDESRRQMMSKETRRSRFSSFDGQWALHSFLTDDDGYLISIVVVMTPSFPAAFPFLDFGFGFGFRP